MKKSFPYIASVIVLLSTGCTKDFNTINTDPTQATAASFDPNLLLPSIQYKYVSGNAGYSGPILFQSMWVQILASTTSGAANYYLNGDKYVATTGTPSYLVGSWNTIYGGASFAYEMQNLTKDKPSLSNLNSVATIMKVLCMQYITDVFGDCPYSQALQNKTGGITLPVYDKQQDIYNSMLNELDAAINQFDASKEIPIDDVFPYKGNIAQWKKFGYSLMLRMAMRLTKVDPETARKWTEKAAAGGTFASVADDAYLICDNANAYGNPNASAMITPGDVYEVRWSKTLIDYFRGNQDPRLGLIAEVPLPGLAENKDVKPGNPDSAVQIGMPNGYDLNAGATDITKSPGYPGGTGSGNDFTPIGKYSRPNALYRNLSGPLFVLTYAETELLLAEAVVRGWNVPGTAAQHYWNGVSGGLQTLTVLGTAVSPATANAYATAHPLDISSMNNSLKQINERYWATDGALFNFVEAWNNWRRSGYPLLTPVNYTANFSGGQIPRREIYPPSESTLNPTNYQAAVSNLQGGDNWSSRVWWDK